MFGRFLNPLSSGVWILRVENGSMKVVKGKLPSGFVAGCRGVLRDAGIRKGQVSGRQAGGYVTLEFSKEIPGRLHQRLRNLWSDYEKR